MPDRAKDTNNAGKDATEQADGAPLDIRLTDAALPDQQLEHVSGGMELPPDKRRQIANGL